MTTIANFTVEGPVGSGSAGGNPVLLGALDGSGNTVALSTSGNGTFTIGTGVSNAFVTLLAAGTITAPGTVNGTAVTDLGKYKQIQVLLNVTAAANAADDTMDVYIDSSFDGSTWVNVVHFPQILGNGGAKKFVATLDPAGSPGTACVAVTSDAAVNTVRPSFFGDRLRVRTVNVDGASPGAESFTFSVTAFAKA